MKSSRMPSKRPGKSTRGGMDSADAARWFRCYPSPILFNSGPLLASAFRESLTTRTHASKGIPVCLTVSEPISASDDSGRTFECEQAPRAVPALNSLQCGFAPACKEPSGCTGMLARSLRLRTPRRSLGKKTASGRLPPSDFGPALHLNCQEIAVKRKHRGSVKSNCTEMMTCHVGHGAQLALHRAASIPSFSVQPVG